MAVIYESENFIVKSWDDTRPHIDRNDGGHIVISPKVPCVDRQELTPKQAIELMRLTVVAGEAMTKVMNEHGVDIGRINYQDNGNWGVFSPNGPHLHIHLYGRAKSAKVQRYGQACNFPHIKENPNYYENFEYLTEEDVKGIKKEIERLFTQEKYSDKNWQA